MNNFRTLVEQAAKLSRPNGVVVEPHQSGAVVRFPNGRHQALLAERQGDRYILTSRVVGRARVDGFAVDDLMLRIWQRNRDTDVVAFGLDRRGRLVGRIEALAGTLSPDELAFYIEQLARECDQLEYVLSGQDSGKDDTTQ